MTPITSLGLSRLREHLQELKTELVRTFDERSAAAAEGDLKENSAYIFMTERAHVLQSQIDKASADIKDASIIIPPKDTHKVALGHRVKVLFKNENRELTLTLVGKNDNALKPGWISADSPLGIAILGRPAGTSVIVNDQPVAILEITHGDIE
ncbi:GreA/GreB family elongation factor [Candidatus Shapirobacteria bacterium]|nr:GreA/GreB family elongation factor [Candidatus Shapirobacteria bacterium]